MSAAAPPSAPSAPKDVREHDELIKAHLTTTRTASGKVFTTNATFTWMDFDRPTFGLLSLQILDTGFETDYYTLLPILEGGDLVKDVKNTGFQWAMDVDWHMLENTVVTWRISLLENKLVYLSFYMPNNDLIAVVMFTNAQITWIGAHGSCTFFSRDGG
ncbi:hypothetical protein CALCODRAFT_553488 [Calocera cornea HHB12733]|uniref:Uncharacterized protein n=1 Tax=Calocera cornea HHB12733 TaxID=1353952 RepID=A0A165IMS4_9BASI|nr:hypothetical protein CALCODRAFT_553488 [Calocera cornea HHB12733]